MKHIIHAYQISPKDPEKYLTGERKNLILLGYYILPVYALNQGIVEIVDSEDNILGYVAVEEFTVTCLDKMNERRAKKYGFNTLEELKLFCKGEEVITLVKVIPVIEDVEEDCDCEECNCENCDCKNRKEQQ